MTTAEGAPAVGHTPGPWEVQMHYLSVKDVETATQHGFPIPRALTNDGECPVMAGTGDDRCRVALVSSQTAFKRGKGWEVECATRDANARLIAASPDLADALNKLLKRYTGLVECGDCGNWDAEAEPEVIDARAALRKAGAL